MLPDQSISFKGIHHIALATADLEETRNFYKDVLGMQVSEIYPSKAGRGRHCLILLKPDDSDIWGFHFFERPSVGKRVPGFSEVSPADFLLHIALRLSDETSARALKECLNNAHVVVTDIPELGSFLFADNNGLLLEATWPATEKD